MLRSKTSSWTRVACKSCSRLSGRCGASRKAVNNAYSPFVSATGIAFRIGEPSSAAIEMPAAKSAPTLLHVALRGGTAGFSTPQHGTDTGQKLAQTEWLGHVVVGAKFQPDHPVDLIASMAGDDNHRNIETRSDLAQEIQAVFVAQTEIEDNQVGFSSSKMPHHLISLRGRHDAQVVPFEIVRHHLPDRRVIIDDKNACRLRAVVDWVLVVPTRRSSCPITKTACSSSIRRAGSVRKRRQPPAIVSSQPFTDQVRHGSDSSGPKGLLVCTPDWWGERFGSEACQGHATG